MNDLNLLFSQAISFHQSGRLKEALSLYLKILPLQRSNDELLFTIGTAYCQAGELEEGLNHLRKSSRLNPKNYHVFGNMGRVLTDLKRFEEAVINYTKALQLNPKFTEARFGRANALVDANKPNDALTDYDKIISEFPDFAVAYCNKGKALQQLKQLKEASECIAKAIDIDPSLAEAHNNLANVYLELEQYENALNSYNTAIQLNPRLDGVFTNIGCVLTKLNRLNEAIDSHTKAIELNPMHADAHLNKGIVLQKLGQFEVAVSAYDRAIELKNNYTEAYVQKGEALIQLKRPAEALDCFNKASAVNPDFPLLAGAKLQTLMELCEWHDFDDQVALLKSKTLSGATASQPFTTLALMDDPATQRVAAESFCKTFYPSLNKPFSAYESASSKLKIGYFSADFHDHATMHLIRDLLANHDKNGFETIGFSFGPITNDPWQMNAIRCFDQFINCRNMSDTEVSTLARKLQISIAVDLKGYTGDARPGIFSQRAAPIQINFLGYPGTMGAPYIDYLIADSTLIPESFRKFYTEKIAYLPDCYQPNCLSRDVSDSHVVRSDFSLPESGFIFSSFNNNYKITPRIFASWMRILGSVDNSVLWLLTSNTTAEANLKRHAEANGIDGSRLIFAQRLPIQEHLNRINIANLMLDTFPYGAHTTCSDALRMKLPLITMIGNSFASRVAASLLKAVGLPELITESYSEYEGLAITLANNPTQLSNIRSRLEENLASSSLFNPSLFTKELESLYSRIHKMRKNQQPLDNIVFRPS